MKVPKPFPDELLLSRLNRYVTMYGVHIGEFTEKAFGRDRVSVHPFLPAGIEQLAALLGENKNRIINEQTLAPLFFLFMSKHATRLKNMMLACEGAKAFRHSQLASFSSRHTLCLKWCPVCAGKELKELGVAYWHRTHQIPGLTACPFHPVLLHRMLLVSRQRVMAGCLPSHTDAVVPAAEVEVRVARFAYELLQLNSRDRGQLDLASAYRHKLTELGFITAHGRVRREGVMKEFMAVSGLYRPAVDTDLPRNDRDYRYFSQLLEPESSHHPFRHLLFSCWLYNQPQDLFKRIHSSSSASDSTRLESSKKLRSIELKCLTLLRESRSLAEIYRITGKSRCYLKRLALLNAIPITTKPRALTEECKQCILRLAHAGVHRKAISKRCSIGIGSVEQVVSSTHGMVERRKLCHWESKRRRCRVKILRYRQSYPKAIRQQIKVQCNAEFFWLYLNDRGWLEAVLPKSKKPIGRIR
ncbi:MAG: TnsD family Tn7-like transposition protein [Oceanisphaera sp.]|uniref:TnsD family Tn7-like transposition protein n=1 Tax=Oceanisphaera sp. TaxID=1929979 RepID=UPI003C7613C4